MSRNRGKMVRAIQEDLQDEEAEVGCQVTSRSHHVGKH